MPTWTDESGEVVASTTFTDAQGRRHINGVEVPEAAWEEFQAVVVENDGLRAAIAEHRDQVTSWNIANREPAPADKVLWVALDLA